MFLPSLQNITSVSVGWDGPHQFNAKQHSFQISSNRPVMNERFGRKSSPPFFWLSVRAQSSLMISSRHCLISSYTSTLFRPPRGLSLIRPSLMYPATIPLAVERFTRLLTCLLLTSNPLPHPQKYGLFALSVL